MDNDKNTTENISDVEPVVNENNLYNEKNNAVIAPESYYQDLTVRKENGAEERYEELFSDKKPKSAVWSVLSLIFGVVSVIWGIFGWHGMIFGIIAIAMAVISRIRLGYFDTFTVWGMILGIFGTVFGISRLLFYLFIEKGIFIGKEPEIGLDNSI